MADFSNNSATKETLWLTNATLFTNEGAVALATAQSRFDSSFIFEVSPKIGDTYEFKNKLITAFKNEDLIDLWESVKVSGPYSRVGEEKEFLLGKAEDFSEDPAYAGQFIVSYTIKDSSISLLLTPTQYKVIYYQLKSYMNNLCRTVNPVSSGSSVTSKPAVQAGPKITTRAFGKAVGTTTNPNEDKELDIPTWSAD